MHREIVLILFWTAKDKGGRNICQGEWRGGPTSMRKGTADMATLGGKGDRHAQATIAVFEYEVSLEEERVITELGQNMNVGDIAHKIS